MRKSLTKPVFLKVNGIATQGAILMGKGAEKAKGVIGGQKTRRGQKCSTTN